MSSNNGWWVGEGEKVFCVLGDIICSKYFDMYGCTVQKINEMKHLRFSAQQKSIELNK